MKWTVSVFSWIMIALLSLVAHPAFAQSEVHKKAIQTIETGDKSSKREDGKLGIAELMEHHRVSGISIAVFDNFEIVWTRAYGMARTKEEVKVTETTTFQAGSISKPVSAMAALIAVEQGKFSLDVPINTLLTSWKLPENKFTAIRPVTPRMLLSHTGGTTVHGFGGYRPDSAIPELPDVLNGTGTANSKAVIVDIEPFTKWRYSGGGTTVMQLAMEDIHGEAFEDILARSVLEPCGMTNSTFVQPMEISDAPDAAFAHGGKAKTPWHIYPEQAAAGLWTTPTDLARFAITVQKILRGDAGGLLSREMAQAMVTPTAAGGDYGLGFSESGKGLYFGHGGSDWGFVCGLLAHKTKGYGVVVMTNGQAGGEISSELGLRVAEVYEWDRN